MWSDNQVRRYSPLWEIVYLNTNNNARQMRLSAKTSVEHDPEGHHGNDQERKPRHRHHSHTNIAEDPKKLSATGQELNEINFVLMRENIEKMKRIRILKKVKSSFDNMFFRVQELTDGLKIQIDDAMLEHKKANKMVNKLHRHVSGMKGDLDGFQREDDFILSNKADIYQAKRERTQQKFTLPAIESENSSRPSSLPDVFKVNSSDREHAEEELRESRTRNIRKIAVKKSQDKAFTETSSERRKKYSINTYRGNSATSERNVSKATSSCNSMSSIRSNDRKMMRNRNKAIESEDPLDTNGKPVEVCHKTTKKPNKDSVNKVAMHGSQHSSISGPSDEKEIKHQVVEPFDEPRTNEQNLPAHKTTNSVMPFDRDSVNRSSHNRRSQTRPPMKLRKLRKDKIEQDIKSIEECIIQPGKMKKASSNNDAVTDETIKQLGDKRMKSDQKKMN